MSETTVVSYDQPTKRRARREALTHAVELVTTRRNQASVVDAGHVNRVRAFLRTSDNNADQYAGSACKDGDIASWVSFRDSAIGSRSASEITVAYLAGPEPENDLNVLLELGVRPENIWAFEIEKGHIQTGWSSLKVLKQRGVKFIPASIEDFFISTPRRFDIIYFDACGPLPSPSAHTSRILVTLFRHSALEPLGILITNFSRPDIFDDTQRKAFSFLIASYLHPKLFLEAPQGGNTDGAGALGYYLNPSEALLADIEAIEGSEEGESHSIRETEIFERIVEAEFDHYYGTYITRSLIDIASIIAPTIRLMSGDLYKIAFPGKLENAIARGKTYVHFDPSVYQDSEIDEFNPHGDDIAERPDTAGDAICDSDLYSLLATLAACGAYGESPDWAPPPADAKKLINAWRASLKGKNGPGKHEIHDIVAAFYAWRHDPSLWSDAMKRLADFPYRERMTQLCDVPTSELAFYPVFAQLSYPSHPNIRETKRFLYQAEGRQTPMFMDVIAFDECRYVYDWLSALHLVPEDWSEPSAQLTFRFAVDAIAKELRWFGDDFLSGCHVVGINQGFPASELSARVNLNLILSGNDPSEEGGADRST